MYTHTHTHTFLYHDASNQMKNLYVLKDSEGQSLSLKEETILTIYNITAFLKGSVDFLFTLFSTKMLETCYSVTKDSISFI